MVNTMSLYVNKNSGSYMRDYQYNLLFYKKFGLNYHYRKDQWLLIVLL